MTDLLDEIVEAHGGLARWNELETVSAHLVQGGAVWGLKGRQGVLDDVRIEQWRRLRVVWPAHLATRNRVQTVYVDDDGLIRREDYDVDVMAGSPGAHYIAGFTQVAGITLPTERRILPRTPEGQALAEPLLVSIDLSDLTFA
ncbi:hypothetical protein ABT234_33145 [Streptomyces sp. NPDC001586]|uniref:hypothetical protein n=1 Tax=Streptomyces sp. NPDC001586 TaxID=3154387 RepID=UPI0033327100